MERRKPEATDWITGPAPATGRSLAGAAALFACLLLASFAAAGEAVPAGAPVVASLANLPLHFEPNRGQFDPQVKYASRASGYTLFLAGAEAVINARRAGGGCIVRMRFAGSMAEPRMEGIGELPGKCHYFKGGDPAKWRRNVPRFARVRIEDVYPGIDIEYYGNQRRLEFDFAVEPGADPARIEMAFEGVQGIALDASGRALLALPGEGELVLDPPLVFQEAGGRKVEVPSRYVARGGQRLGICLGRYDRSVALRIDPTLGYSAFLGGSGLDKSYAIAVDSNGKAHVTGYGADDTTDFPTTSGAYDETHNGGTYDVFVAKLSADGSSLEYSTYLGGSGTDIGYGIAVDSSGKAYIVGYTSDSTTDFPTTSGAYDETHNGGTFDVFVAKLSADGSSLEYSTFLGGGASDRGNGIAVDSDGKAYVTGRTGDATTDFPATTGAYDETHNGGTYDVFVTKLSANGSSLDYSTFLGGSGSDAGFAIAVDSSGKAYVTGYTPDALTQFPTTVGAYDTSHGSGTDDVFVTKLAADGASLEYSTFLGGGGASYAYGIAVDSNGKAYVTGYTEDVSPAYPTTAGAYDTTHNGGTNDVFVTKLAADGSSLDYSTFLGGTGSDIAISIAVDASGYATVAGYTASTNFPLASAFQGTHGGGTNDGFVTCVRAAGNLLFYSSFHGGSADDKANGVALDSSGNAYLAGETADGATDLATTTGAYDETHNGSTDAFVTKVSIAGTAVRLLDFTATSGKDGDARLAWRTGLEVDNLGFHLWLEHGRRWHRITPRLLAGSGVLAGERVSLEGFSYSFCDTRSGPEARYWLEAVDLAGARTWHGPAVIQTSSAVARAVATPRAARPLASVAGAAGTVRRGAAPRARVLGAAVRGAAAAALKIRVREEGWYRLRAEDLLAAGLPPSSDPRGLRLLTGGREAAIRITGSEDKRLDPGDSVEFYGQGIDSPWEDSRVYWLAPGRLTGKRIALVPRSRAPFSRASPSTFPFTLEHQERTFYFAALLNGEAENFFGSLVTDEPVKETLDARHVALDAKDPCLIEVSLQGVTEVRHRVAVTWNDAFLGFMESNGKERTAATFPVHVEDGENVITLASEGGEADVSAVDALRLTYPRRAVAEDGFLRLTARGGRRATVGGLGMRNVLVLDVTDPWRPHQVPVRVAARGTERLASFIVPGRGRRTLLACEERAARDPLSIEADSSSDWAGERQGADLVIISHGNLLDPARALKTRREEEGWSVLLADVEDIYDEFEHGHKSPGAIREFVAAARERWKTPPRFLILLGDATLDPRDRLGRGVGDLVPTKLVDTAFLETASDEWLGDVDGDGVSEVAVGRLPARTIEEAWAMVTKLTAPRRAGGEGHVVLVADRRDGFDFEASSRSLLEHLPAHLAVEEIYRGTPGVTAEQTLATSLAAGPLLVNYFGHGSVEVWGGSVLTSAVARSLEGPACPIFILMTCLNGFFHDIDTECLAESLLKAPGGALAVWASSGLSVPEAQAALDRKVLRLLLDGTGRTLGEAIQEAKRSASDPDVRRTWVLLGDPTLRVR